ncbi:helix-turn-helix domain-containing protein [Microbacterium elymi]|uniref:Helix-turn-helix domain-containing protein n=1 Tax=Microbacterium elymi TaxID=2909587 RepID=A0ABY5NHI7_9MICO|nr:helix-turn-helix domain-containing protein [Microbacterium elymi]UUT34655.1 helix-turn-helix domain-containing protein [Microbacterium elymi]
MTEVTTADAARRLGLSQERVSQMLRSGELVGRRISARGWLVDLASVAERARVATAGGRPWSENRVRSVIDALSNGEATDPKTRALIRTTEPDVLWRKLAQAGDGAALHCPASGYRARCAHAHG